MARNYFEVRFRRSELPSDIQTEVQTYVAAVDKAVAINQFSVYGQFGLAYQTNANAGPNSPNVLALGQNALLRPNSKRRRTGTRLDWSPRMTSTISTTSAATDGNPM